jgi:predicted amidohydrolase YtcJ
MLITNAHLITWGEPNEILEGQAILIRDGKIVEWGPSDKMTRRYPEESELLDARGQYVMPGNINAHGHY